MQLLGIGTSLWPAVMDLHLNRVALVLTWAIAAGATLLTIIAVPLYIVLSVPWSGLALFSGSILQSLLQLQLVLGISKPKEHQD